MTTQQVNHAMKGPRLIHLTRLEQSLIALLRHSDSGATGRIVVRCPELARHMHALLGVPVTAAAPFNFLWLRGKMCTRKPSPFPSGIGWVWLRAQEDPATLPATAFLAQKTFSDTRSLEEKAETSQSRRLFFFGEKGQHVAFTAPNLWLNELILFQVVITGQTRWVLTCAADTRGGMTQIKVRR